MRAASGPVRPDKPADPIIVHPAVRRMLLTNRAYTEAGRAFSTWVAQLIDQELSHPDPAVREQSVALVTLLTPVINASITDTAFDAIHPQTQVFGGTGHNHEWGIAQLPLE